MYGRCVRAYISTIDINDTDANNGRWKLKDANKQKKPKYYKQHRVLKDGQFWNKYTSLNEKNITKKLEDFYKMHRWEVEMTH